MNVRRILKQWLVDNGYDGLYSTDECYCYIDDLAYCGDIDALCRPGCKIPGDKPHTFCIGPKSESDNRLERIRRGLHEVIRACDDNEPNRAALMSVLLLGLLPNPVERESGAK